MDAASGGLIDGREGDLRTSRVTRRAPCLVAEQALREPLSARKVSPPTPCAARSISQKVTLFTWLLPPYTRAATIALYS